jgi:hypothetical protein
MTRRWYFLGNHLIFIWFLLRRWHDLQILRNFAKLSILLLWSVGGSSVLYYWPLITLSITNIHGALISSNCVVKRQADKAIGSSDFLPIEVSWFQVRNGCVLQSSSVLLCPTTPLFTWPYLPPFYLGMNSNNHYLRCCHNPIVTVLVVLHINHRPIKSRRKVGCPEQRFEFGLRTSLNQVKRQAFGSLVLSSIIRTEEDSRLLYDQHSCFTTKSFILPLRLSSPLVSSYLFFCTPWSWGLTSYMQRQTYQ